MGTMNNTTVVGGGRSMGKVASMSRERILSTRHFLWDPESKTFSANLSALQNEGIMVEGPCKESLIGLASTKTKVVKWCQFLKKIETPKHTILEWHWRSADMTFDIIIVNDLNFV